MAVKRTVIGSLMKSKDEKKSDYIQIDKRLTSPIVLQPGQTISFESKAFKLKSLQAAGASGKLTGELLEKLLEQANKMPDFVRGELVLLSDK